MPYNHNPQRRNSALKDMSDQPDSRPVFTIVMGCNGVGKSAWKRHNYDQLPDHYFDQDSIAGGIGDWNSETPRHGTTNPSFTRRCT